MRTLICESCGGSFTQSGRGRPRKKCRPNCGWVERPCDVCGEVFTGPPGQRMCGETCRNTANAIRNRKDREAQRRRGQKGGAVRGAQLRGTAKRSSYLKRDGRHEHRMVAESVLGRPLTSFEVVHHEDENKHNNHPDNLVVFISQGEHAKHHKLGHPGKGPCTCNGIRLGEVMPR